MHDDTTIPVRVLSAQHVPTLPSLTLLGCSSAR